jgi:sigma54-dependent transcription regulator
VAISALPGPPHQVSGEFVEVNCATRHGDGSASTLFGHRKGAFTGAVADRAGRLRSAHDGVLFVDEIGELGPDEQATLLKAIEEKRFLPVGSEASPRPTPHGTSPRCWTPRSSRTSTCSTACGWRR